MVASLLSISAHAGQASGSFQLGIKIVAPPPAPKVSREVTFMAFPGKPPRPVAKGYVERQIEFQEDAGLKFIVLKTEC